MLYEDFVEHLGELTENNIPISVKSLRNTIERSKDILCHNMKSLIKSKNLLGYSFLWDDPINFGTVRSMRMNDITVLNLSKKSNYEEDTSILLKVNDDKETAIVIGVASYRYSGELIYANKIYIDEYIERNMVEND